MIDRDIAVLEARIFGRCGFKDCAKAGRTTMQQAEWICRRLHPIRREVRINSDQIDRREPAMTAPAQQPVANTAAAPDLGPKPRLEFHPPDCLVSDRRYQRSLESRGSQNLIRKIVEQFYWPYFGVIIATDNADGTYCVIDGQHRAEAAKRIPAVRSVPVMVLDEMSLADQAATFIRVNTDRVSLNAMQLHHAAARAGDPSAIALERVLSAQKLTVASTVRQSSHRKPGEIMCVRALSKILQQTSEDHLVRVVQVVASAYEREPGDLVAPIFRAVSLCLEAGEASAAVLDRLREHPAETWIARARSKATVSGRSAAAELPSVIMGRVPGQPRPTE